MWGRGLPTHLILEGPPAIEVILRQSARARRLSLRVSALDSRVSLTVPRGVRLREAEAFLLEKENWLRSALARNPETVRVGIGQSILFQGEARRIDAAPVRAVRLGEDAILVPQNIPEKTATRVQAFLKLQARQHLQSATNHYTQKLGRDYGRITLRDTRSRWGSCSAEGNLNYSWRLIMAPPDVLNYVAAHEAAHLAEMNHSRAFWNVVTELYGPYDAQRRWLRTNGVKLHRYRFED